MINSCRLIYKCSHHIFDSFRSLIFHCGQIILECNFLATVSRILTAFTFIKPDRIFIKTYIVQCHSCWVVDRFYFCSFFNHFTSFTKFFVAVNVQIVFTFKTEKAPSYNVDKNTMQIRSWCFEVTKCMASFGVFFDIRIGTGLNSTFQAHPY